MDLFGKRTNDVLTFVPFHHGNATACRLATVQIEDKIHCVSEVYGSRFYGVTVKTKHLFGNMRGPLKLALRQPQILPSCFVEALVALQQVNEIVQGF